MMYKKAWFSEFIVHCKKGPCSIILGIILLDVHIDEENKIEKSNILYSHSTGSQLDIFLTTEIIISILKYAQLSFS